MTEIYKWLANDVFPDNSLGFFINIGNRDDTTEILINNGWRGLFLREDVDIVQSPIDYEIPLIIELLYINARNAYDLLKTFAFTQYFVKTIVVPPISLQILMLLSHNSYTLVKQTKIHHYYLSNTYLEEYNATT